MTIVASVARALAPRSISGLGAISAGYDVVLLDQYGVLHSGERLLPGVAEALAALHDAGKKLVVVSNTSRRAAQLVAELPKRGFEASWLAGAVCSGELCFRALEADWAGRRALFLGWNRDGDCSYLPESVTVGGAEDCDVVVAQGPDVLWAPEPIRTRFKEDGNLEPYRSAFEQCVARGVPLLCANPDLITLDPSGRKLCMPGQLSRFYRELGGSTIEFGKPNADIFRAAIAEVAPDNEKAAVVHVGDSLAHDIQGAVNAGIDSVFVVHPGVHAAELREETSPAAVAQLARTVGCEAPPTYVCDRFAY